MVAFLAYSIAMDAPHRCWGDMCPCTISRPCYSTYHGSTYHGYAVSEQCSLMGTALPPVRLSFADHNLRSAMCSLITCISHTQSYNHVWSRCCVLQCLCAARDWAPRFEFRGSGLACLGASSPFYGHSMSLEQAIMRLELCMFELGGIWTGSFGRFTPHLCLIPSMHDS